MSLHFRYPLLCALLITAFGINAQNAKILHFTETSGFDHNTRANSFAMFQSFPNVSVTDDSDGSEFSVLSNLMTYDLIVFSNTSGSSILDSTQQANFELYMQSGGNLLGIHAATDTYRHSTANGTGTGVWDYYAETLGGSVQQSPNHVTGTPLYNIYHVNSHHSTSGLPHPWPKNEEYYYWENGYLDSAIQHVLKVEETVGPNGQVNSYDSTRAVSWYKTSASGSSIFYTSLGHANSNFTSDSLFIQHIRQATDWCLSRFVGLPTSAQASHIKLFPNPAHGSVYIQSISGKMDITIYTLSGQPVKFIQDHFGKQKIDLDRLAEGVYFVECKGANFRHVEKLLIK